MNARRSLLVSLAGTALLAGAAAAKGADICVQTALDASKSCQTDTQGDYQLALAKCDNVAAAAARTACRSEASAALRDAQAECQDEFNSRDDACDRLGPAAYDPVIEQANFVAVIDNPFFPLAPGTTFVYEGQTSEGFTRDEFAVTHNTKVIDGVTCVEVHDVVFLDGVLAEDTLDWFAQDRQGNVWYFGENTHELEDGIITTIDGSFLSGIDRAKPGIIMKAHPAVGDFYRQEFDLGNAEDNADTISLAATAKVPYGTFKNCLQSRETTPLEPDLLEDKYYAAGVGNILTVDVITGERIELVQIKK